MVDSYLSILGLIPTTLFMDAGDVIEPSVSVPIVPNARPSEADTPLPLELPEGSWFG